MLWIVYPTHFPRVWGVGHRRLSVGVLQVQMMGCGWVWICRWGGSLGRNDNGVEVSYPIWLLSITSACIAKYGTLTHKLKSGFLTQVYHTPNPVRSENYLTKSQISTR